MALFRVLYVDDEPQLLELGKIFLEQTGQFSIDTSTSAPDALHLLNTIKYDAIIADYLMPKMNGIDFLKEVRRSGNSTPFILFTGRGREEVVIQALNEGADSYLQKGGDPVPQFTELSHKIRQAIQKKMAEGQLQESEDRYRTLIEHADEAILVVQDGRICFANPKLEKITGYSAEEFARISFLEFVHPDDRARIGEEHNRRLSGEVLKEHYIFRIVSKGGSVLWNEIRSSLISWNGQPAVLVLLQDITERRKAEEALRESEERFRSFIEQSLEGVSIVDEEGRIIVWNTAQEHITGIARTHALGVCAWDLAARMMPDEHRREKLRSRMMESIQATIESGTSTHPEPVYYRFLRPDGTIAIARQTVFVIKTPDGHMIGTLNQDVTEQQRAEEKIKESEASYRGLFDTVLQAIYILDREGKFIDVNAGAQTMYGYSREEFIGKTPEFLSAPQKNNFPAVARQIQKAFAGEPQEFEFWGLRKNKEIFPKDVRLYKGTYFGRDVIIAIGTDITRRKQAEEQVSSINSAFLTFSSDPVANITILTTLAGRMLKGSCALYNRIEGGMLCSVGMWNTPPDFIRCDTPEGHICNDIILNGGSSPTIISNLLESPYAETDPNVRRYQLKTYVGIPVRIGERKFGSLCVVYQDPYSPAAQDLEILSFIAKAIAIEDERRNAGQALLESEEKFRSLVEYALESISIIDFSGKGLFTNRATARLLELDENTPLSGRSVMEFLSRESQKDALEDFARAMGGEDAYLTQYTVTTAKGNAMSVECIGKVISYEGKPAILLSLRDITGRKKTEDALRSANRQLNLLTGLTRHDILNKISVILGFLKITQMKTTDPAIGEYLMKINTATTAIKSQIEFTRVYQDLGTHDPQWLALDMVMPRSFVPSTITLNAGGKGIQVLADPMLEKVFFNLLDNSVRHGQRVTEIRVSTRQEANGLVVVWEDNGIGIAADEKERIFEREFGKNTGLGMFLAREILALTGITIMETGEPGKGARFEILVPEGGYRVNGE